MTAADELLTDQGPLVPVDVLLVEDDPGDVLMTREAFEQRGMRNRLHVVSDGEQAIEFLRHAGDFSAAPTPGLILLDLNLPRRNGLEVLDEVKSDSELLRIPVVVLTTSDAQEDIARSYSLHANAYVTKPIDFDRFMNTIGQIDDFYLTLVKTPGRRDQRTALDHDQLSWRRVAIRRQRRLARPMESGRPIPSGLDQGRNEVLSAISFDVAVLEMIQDERSPDGIADLAGAGGDVLKGAPSAGEQGEPSFPQAARGALDRVACAGIDIEFPPASGLPDRDQDADACAFVAGIGQGRQASGAARYSVGRARAAVMSCTEPGSTSETHSGNPPGPVAAWMLPP